MSTIAYKNKFYAGPVNQDNALQNILGDFANIEVSPAQSAHSAGDFIVYNEKLYKVSSAISVGNPLVVGTNIVQTDVGSEISQINSNSIRLQKRILKAQSASNYNMTTSKSSCTFVFIISDAAAHGSWLVNTSLTQIKSITQLETPAGVTVSKNGSDPKLLSMNNTSGNSFTIIFLIVQNRDNIPI